MNSERTLRGALALTLLIAALLGCAGPTPGTGGKEPPPAAVTTTDVEGTIAVPGEFLAGITLAELMSSARVWLVSTEGEFVTSSSPTASGEFAISDVPAGVPGQRLLALFGSGDDAVSLEASLGTLPPSSEEIPVAYVNISLTSTVQAELSRDPELAEALRMEVLDSLPQRLQGRLRPMALRPLDEEASAGMITLVGDTSSLAGRETASGASWSGASGDYATASGECVWSNPLTWLDCWATPDIQVQSGGQTSSTVRRPAVPEDHLLGIEFQNPVAARIIAAGGGNIIAAGGGNIIAAGGGNIIAAGGGNIIATGGGNIISTGGLNSDGIRTSAAGIEVVRRVDFGDVLEEGEIGELRRFGAQVISDFVLVPADLFDEYSNEEVAFIARNIAWAGQRGQEAAERIIADMRAREAAAHEIQERFRRARETPPVTLPSEAKLREAPSLVFLETAAGQSALAAPVIVSAAIPAEDPNVVEIVTRNVSSDMKAFWRSEDGAFEAAELNPAGGERFRIALSSAGHSSLMVGMPGPSSPYSNVVQVAREPGSVTTPPVVAEGFEGIGGQGSDDVTHLVEDGDGNLFMADMGKTVLYLPAGAHTWTNASEGLKPERSWDARNLLTVGASSSGELLILLDSQAYRLHSDGVWREHGPALRDVDPIGCPFPANGLVDPEGGIYQLERCSGTYYLQYLDPSGSAWSLLATDSMAVDGPMQLAGDGSIYLMGRKGGWQPGVLRYAPGSSSFELVFSSAVIGAKAVQLTVDDAGTPILLTRTVEATEDDSTRIYLRADDAWHRLVMEAPFDHFFGDGIARPRGDGPLYVLADDNDVNRNLYRLDPGSTSFVREEDPRFEWSIGDYRYSNVQQLWPGQNGSLFVLANGLLLRKSDDSSGWEDLSAGLSGDGNLGAFAFSDGTALVKSGGLIFERAESGDSWQRSEAPSSYFGVQLYYDSFGVRAVALDEGGLYEWQAGSWQVVSDEVIDGTRSMAFDSEGSVYALSYLADTTVHVFDGESWNSLGAVNDTMLTMAATAGGDLYLAGYEGVYWRAKSSGEWAELGSLFRGGAQAYRVAVAADGTVYGTWAGYGVSRFIPAEGSWETINHGLPSSNGESWGAFDLAIDGSGAVFAATDWGVYRLEPAADEWTAVPGLIGVQVNALAVGPDNRLYVDAGKQGVFRSLP